MNISDKIPVSRPSISKADIQAVERAVKSTFIAAGPNVIEFENKLAEHCGRKFAVAVSSGTSALLIGLKAFNLPSGSKVLVSSFTIVSALYAIIAGGYIPVFVDINEKTWNVDECLLDKLVKNDIKAAIIVQTYASSPPMWKIYTMLKKYNIPMLEDTAEGLGGEDKRKKFGSFGKISILSFYANKLISTGEGGMILTDEKELYERACSLRNLFFDKERKFIHRELSGNHRMTNYQAALGLSQLKQIAFFYNHRKKLYSRYLTLLNDLQEYIQFQYIPKDIKSSYWVFPLLLQRKAHFTAAQFIEALAEKKVEARHFFYPLDKQPFLPEDYQIDSKISYNLWRDGLYLPLGNGIKLKEVEKVSQIVRKLLKRGCV